MNTKELKRTYEKPAMQVVELKQRCQILAGSAGMQDYTMNDYYEE